MRQLLICCFLTLVLSPVAFAQVDFKAQISKSELGINERLRIEFSMNKEGDNFKPPSFNGFRIAAGPSQSGSNIYANGKSALSRADAYLLIPLKKGKITKEHPFAQFKKGNKKNTNDDIEDPTLEYIDDIFTIF